jgi:hypothetical protein
VLPGASTPATNERSIRFDSMDKVKAWAGANYAEPMGSVEQSLRVAYVVLSFCAAFFLGGIKGARTLSLSITSWLLAPPWVRRSCCRRVLIFFLGWDTVVVQRRSSARWRRR